MVYYWALHKLDLNCVYFFRFVFPRLLNWLTALDSNKSVVWTVCLVIDSTITGDNVSSWTFMKNAIFTINPATFFFIHFGIRRTTFHLMTQTVTVSVTRRSLWGGTSSKSGFTVSTFNLVLLGYRNWLQKINLVTTVTAEPFAALSITKIKFFSHRTALNTKWVLFS